MSDDYLKTYEEFWRELVETDGKLDRDKVARELSDYSFLMHEVPKVYDHVSGGMISKPNTHAFEVNNRHDDLMREACEEAVKEETEELREEVSRLNLQVEQYRKALEDIAGRRCCDEVCFGPCSQDRAAKALADKRLCVICKVKPALYSDRCTECYAALVSGEERGR